MSCSNQSASGENCPMTLYLTQPQGVRPTARGNRNLRDPSWLAIKFNGYEENQYLKISIASNEV